MTDYHRHSNGDVIQGEAIRCIDPDAGATDVLVLPAIEAQIAALVERVMCDEGWVCNRADHDNIPNPGECINCDGERHRTGFRIYAALAGLDRAIRPGQTP